MSLNNPYTPEPGDQVRIRRYDVPVPELPGVAERQLLVEYTGTVATAEAGAGGVLLTLEGLADPIFTGYQFSGQDPATGCSWSLHTEVTPLNETRQHDDPRITRPGPGYRFADRELLNITRLGLSRIYTAPSSEASPEMQECARQALARLEGLTRIPFHPRITISRTLEHGTMEHLYWSPSAGIWTAEVLIDGDARLTSVPLSELEPEYTKEGA